ncbi:MAG: glycerol-3-phosphate 1-O-acyltransferase PlsB [Oleiphilaceae bacterium]|nr:glycerol-3-phosphate 1-O-acyltransferase PlsB [Oleiphilaceae bacterium]
MSRFFKLSTLLFTFFRKILFLWVRVDIKGAEADELELDPDKPVIYVLQYRTFSGRLVLEESTIRQKLPSSQTKLALGNSDVRRSFFFLYEPLGRLFKRKQRPTVTGRLKQLAQHVADDDDSDVQIVPVSIFWGRAPTRERSWLQLLLTDNWSVASPLRQLFIILLHGRRTYVQFSKPISLQELYGDSEKDAKRTQRMAARILRVHFRRVRQTVIGPNLSHRQTLVQTIVDTPTVRDAIAKESEASGKPKQELKQQALKYGDEIAASLQISTIHFLERVLNRLWNKIYKGIYASNVEAVKEVTKDHAVVYVPCHRSHIDYLLLSSLLFREGIMVPHIAAGINLNLPVVGSILRRGGAFFMRRSFKGNKLYAAVFAEYIHIMFKRGYSIEYFVEGGRSRTGRTLQPKAGMVAMTVASYLKDQQKPIAFIPVYFGYEKVLEGSTYMGELRGKEKQKESVFGLFKSLKNLRKSFGKVALNFGEPIILENYLDQNQSSWKDDIKSIENINDQKPDWFNDVVGGLSKEIATRINASAAVNPVTLTATVLLSTQRQAMDANKLADLTSFFAALLKEQTYSPYITFPEGTGEEWIEYTEDMGLLSRQSNELGDIISLNDRNAVLLTYNRNNTLHLFAIPALIACITQNNPAMSRAEVHRIFRSVYSYIRAELFIQWESAEVDKEFEAWLKLLAEKGLLTLKDDEVHRPNTGSNEFVKLTTLASFIMPTLERYYIVIAILTRKESGSMNAEELEKLSTLMAERMSILFGLNAPEFFDKTLFRNFISILKEKGILEENETGKLNYSELINKAAEDSTFVLNGNLRQAILQVTSGR